MDAVHRRELIIAALILTLGLGLLSIHVHDIEVAQEALFKQREQQAAVEQKAADAKVAALQQQIDAEQKLAAAQTVYSQQLTATIASLSAKLDGLKAQETQQLAQVQVMPVDQLAKALADQLGLKGSTFNPVTGTVTGVTPEALRQLEEQVVSLKACQQERDTLTDEIGACGKRADADALIQKSQAQTIQNLQTELSTVRAADKQQIDVLKQQVKVVRGTFLKRMWNRAKFPVGIAVGLVIGRGFGL